MLNEALLQADNDDRFCTAICGELRFEDGSVVVTLSNGGHPPPLVRRADGGHDWLHPNGPLAGFIHHPTFGQHAVRLATGDALVMYTDGVTESRSHDDLFGESRLGDVVDEQDGRSAEAIGLSILDEVAAFAVAERRDDLALLIIQVRPAQGADPGRTRETT